MEMRARALYRFFHKAFCLLLVGGFLSIYSFAQNDSSEYNVKAMFVLNFMKYVEWPSEPGKNTFKIGVVGETELFNALVNMTLNKNESKKILIGKVDQESTGNYQIIIITGKQNKKSIEWLKNYEDKGVLLISDNSKDETIAAINLLNIDNKIRFDINHSKARWGGVKISSKLADLAITVHP